ncbi:hypothetical protein ACH4GM_06855 [Streptomyces coeruleorubidus]|uniref:hypothetical protein n=1 Tax=Streptomyces coeruleorubidus TaxID=116188 RepID=UPI0037B9C3C8
MVGSIDPAAQQLLVITVHPFSLAVATDSAGLPGSAAEAREPGAAAGLLHGHGLVVVLVLLLVLRRGLFGLAIGGDGTLLAVVTQVRVGLPWGAPFCAVDRLPPFVGELRAAAGADGTARFPLCEKTLMPYLITSRTPPTPEQLAWASDYVLALRMGGGAAIARRAEADPEPGDGDSRQADVDHGTRPGPGSPPPRHGRAQ